MTFAGYSVVLRSAVGVHAHAEDELLFRCSDDKMGE